MWFTFNYGTSYHTCHATTTHVTEWGGRLLRKMFCNMFSESSTGSLAELQLPCCLSKQGELPENMLQNLFLNLLPQTVLICFSNLHDPCCNLMCLSKCNCVSWLISQSWALKERVDDEEAAHDPGRRETELPPLGESVLPWVSFRLKQKGTSLLDPSLLGGAATCS